MEARRIVLLGKQGAGTSRLANLIFGETVFKINCSSKSLTSECQVETKSVNGRSITLIDTSGFFGSERSEDELKSEIVRHITECAPGPQAVLIVLKVEKFTKQERAVIENILQYFSEDAFKYAAVVFTLGEEHLKGKKIEEFVSQNKHLSDLVKKCGGRCHVVDNKYWKNNEEGNYTSNQLQMTELLNMIDKMVMENNKGYQTNDMLQAVKKQMQKKCDSPSAGNMPQEVTDEVHNNVSQNVWIKLTGPAAESLAKSFFGPAIVVSQQNEVSRRGAEEGAAEEEDAAIMPMPPEREAEGVEEAGRGGTTVRVKTASGSPTKIVIAGTGRPGRSIKVLKTYRIVLLGKTRAGKSSLANTIFGEDVFKINHTSICGTPECQTASKSVDGRRITLIDTPGFFDFSSTEEKLEPEVMRCITEYAPGPHAFFIVLEVGKITKQELDVITKKLHYFSEEALKYAAVVFTHGEQLPQGMKIEEFVDQNEFLSDLVEKCGGRCHVVDNKYWKNNQHSGYRSNEFQVAELLNTTDKIVTENKGGCYTNTMLQVVKREIEEESVRTTVRNMTQGDTSNKAISSVSKNVWIKFTGTAAQSLAGAFFGPAVVVLQETGGENEGGEAEEEVKAEEPEQQKKKEAEEKPAEEKVEEEGDTETEEEAEQEAATEIKKETEQGRSAAGGGLGGFLGCLFGFFSGIAALFGGLGAFLGGLFGVGAAAGGAGAAAAGAGAAAAGAGAAASVGAGAAAAVAAVALPPLTIVGLIAGAIAWLVSKIKAFLKDLPRHIGIVLLVVAFFLLLLLSLCLKVQILGTLLLSFGVLLSFFLLVLLFLLL